MPFLRSKGGACASRMLTASLAGIFALSVAGATADDGGSDDATDTVRPASIHAGACDVPGARVAQLNDLVLFDDDGSDAGSAGQTTDGGSLPVPTTLPGSGGDDDGSDDGSGGTSGNDDSGASTGGDDDGSGGGIGVDDDGDDDGTGTGTGTDDGSGGTTGGDDDGSGSDDGSGGDDDGGSDDDGGGEDEGSRPGMLAYQAADDDDGSFVGPQETSVVEASRDSAVGIDLAALLAEPHVIAVFDDQGSSTLIACGTIGGYTATGDDDLAVGLRQQNGSGFAGVALFGDDDGDGQLDVDVYLGRDVATDDD